MHVVIETCRLDVFLMPFRFDMVLVMGVWTFVLTTWSWPRQLRMFYALHLGAKKILFENWLMKLEGPC